MSFHGIGIDMVSVSRTLGWAGDAAVLDHVFTRSEKDGALGRGEPHRHLASCFAAKEAFMKAIGTGWSGGIGWKDIEVVEDGGAFHLRLHNKAREYCDGRRVLLSLSAEEGYALAFVAVSGVEEKNG